jgi:hypothetical protein
MTSDWVMITATMVMFVSLFGALGLALIAWRRQSMIKGLQAREQNGLGMSSPVATDRVQALAAREGISQGGVPMPSSTGNGALMGIVAAVLVLLLAGGAAVWWFGFRGSSTSSVSAPQITKPASGPLGADPVAVLNASGVSGAAADVVAPKVETAGYRLGEVGDANAEDLAKSVVMWRPGQQAVAQNVAKDLGITSAPPLDGVASDDIGEAEVVVVVGKDSASSP